MEAATRTRTLINVRRGIREETLRLWDEEWKRATPRGLFGDANLFSPSNKPLSHFFTLPRRVFCLVTQVRLGHAFIGEYYANHVPSEDIACPCGEDVQTRHHVLWDCPLHEDARHVLRDISEDHVDPDVLGTEEGIEALAKFISDSYGAFTKGGVHLDDHLNGGRI